MQMKQQKKTTKIKKTPEVHSLKEAQRKQQMFMKNNYITKNNVNIMVTLDLSQMNVCTIFISVVFIFLGYIKPYYLALTCSI